MTSPPGVFTRTEVCTDGTPSVVVPSSTVAIVRSTIALVSCVAVRPGATLSTVTSNDWGSCMLLPSVSVASMVTVWVTKSEAASEVQDQPVRVALPPVSVASRHSPSTHTVIPPTPLRSSARPESCRLPRRITFGAEASVISGGRASIRTMRGSLHPLTCP